MNKALEIEGLSKKYDDFTLDNISFSLERGYVMGFIGPNGAGKSTTIKLIMNLIKKDSGKISVLGMDSVTHEKKIKEKIGFVYDDSFYYGVLKIKEMAKVIEPFYSEWSRQTFEGYLKKFNLNPDKKIDDLSKGMKMKFSLAVALSHGAELIIMDEPTSGLDPVFRSELLDILYEVIQDENKSIFFSTHITSDLEKIADHITFINNGRIIFSSPKDDILSKYFLIKGGSSILENNGTNLIGLKKNDNGFTGLSDNLKKLPSEFRSKVLIEKASLEDIMLYTVKNS